MNRLGLILVLLAVLVVGVDSQTKPKGKKSVGDLKKSLTKVQANKRQVAASLRKIKRSAQAVMGDIHEADRTLSTVEARIDETEKVLTSSQKEQIRLKAELLDAQKRMDAKRAQAAVRIRQMYMSDNESGILALLASRDMGELAARKAIMEMVTARDRELFDTLHALHQEVSAKKARQDQLVTHVASLLRSRESDRSEIKTQKSKKQNLLSELKGQQRELEAAYAALDRESDSIGAQIRSYQSHSSGGGVKFSGRFIRPSSGPITSGFGYRFHPILKRRKLHTGIDFGGPVGSPIVAAASGVVISAGYHGGYGNAVIIDHGGGISTLYGHCSRVFVQSGQRVSAGQRIAAVGSTGLSTGPHLHFEVRKNGTPINPRV